MLKYLDTTDVFLQQDGGTVYILSLECNYKNVRSWESEVCLSSVRTANNDSAVCISRKFKCNFVYTFGSQQGFE